MCVVVGAGIVVTAVEAVMSVAEEKYFVGHKGLHNSDQSLGDYSEPGN
jgi:hypothetical protein